MIPERDYQEQSAGADRTLLLQLKQHYDERTENRKRASARCKQCLMVLGVNPITGERSRKGGAKHVSATCRKERPQKRVRNKFSTEEAGTIGQYVGVLRWDNSRITKACYRKKFW